MDTSDFKTQRLKHALQLLRFEPLEWRYLEPFLFTYRKLDLLPFVIDSKDVYIPDLTRRTFELENQVSLKDLRFKMGYLCFQQYLPMLDRGEELRINNAH